MEKLTELLSAIADATGHTELNKRLNELFNQYDNAEIIATMAGLFSLEEILKYFKNADVLGAGHKKIKTIGTYYRKLNNGGVPRVLASLLYLWTEMGYGIVLYTDSQESEDDYPYPEAVKRITIPNTQGAYERSSFWQQSLVENQVDIMVHHNWMPSFLIWDILSIKLLHIPFVLYVHGHFTALYDTCSEYNMLSHKVFALCDMVLSLAECNARFYELCGCRSRLIFNPITPELLENMQPASLASRTILWIGRICDEKHPVDAIEILDRVLKMVPDAELAIVGDGAERDMEVLYKLCEAKKIGEHVHFEGFQMNVAPYYQRAALMLMTSEKEGYPTVILESKAFGLPVVMYDLPYLTMTKDKKGVVPVQMGDIEAASDMVAEILMNADKRFCLGQEAKESFETLKQADLGNEWKSIFGSFECEQKETEANATDGLMIQLLMEQLKTASEKSRTDSMDYKVGNMVLKFPRMIYHFMRKCRDKLSVE